MVQQSVNALFRNEIVIFSKNTITWADSTDSTTFEIGFFVFVNSNCY